MNDESDKGDESSNDSLSSDDGEAVAPPSRDVRRKRDYSVDTSEDSDDTGSEESDSDEPSSSEDSDGDADDNDNYNDNNNNNNNNHHVDSSLPLGIRLAAASQRMNDEERQEATKAARQRKKLAREEATKRLAALRAFKIDPKSRQPQKSVKAKKKNRPTEASSKRADFYRRRDASLTGTGVDLGAHRYKPKDPRGDNLVGHFDQDQFHRNYAFITELKQKEIQELKERIAARQATGRRGQKKRRALGITKDGSSLADDKSRLQQLQEELAAQTREQINAAASRAVKKELRETAARVGKPIFLKRKELQKRTDQARLKQIKEQEGAQAVEKVLAKRRKRQKSRDAKRLR